MRTGVTIFILCALIVLGFALPAQADVGLCNHFMALVARARGDVTGEFKRRIAFLLETGKIGEPELNAMRVSEKAVGPFGSGEHLGADKMPHEVAILRLLSEESLDWKEVRKFIDELMGKTAESRDERAIHEKKTEKVVFPVLIKAVKLGERKNARMESSAAIFEKGGKHYAVISPRYSGMFVIEALTGRVVQRIAKTLDATTAPALYMEGDDVYAVVGWIDGAIRIVNISRGKVVQKVQTGTLTSVEAAAVTFREGEITYAVVATDDDVYVVNTKAGTVVQKVNVGKSQFVKTSPALFKKGEATIAMIGAMTPCVIDLMRGKVLRKGRWLGHVESSPAVFTRGGVNYGVMGAYKDTIYILNLSKGGVTRTIKTKGEVESSPALFEDGENIYAVVGTNDRKDADNKGYLYMVNPVTGKVVRRIQTDGAMRSSPAVFQADGTPYAVAGCDDGYIYLFNLSTGSVVGKIKTGDEIKSSPKVFEEDGSIYAMVGSNDGKVYVVQLYGPLPSEGKKK